MPCHRFHLPDGAAVTVCSRGRTRSCASCGLPSTKLCDYPLRGRRAGATCSRPQCDACAVTVGKGPSGDSVDYCRAHAEIFAHGPVQPTLPGL
jgi:hypothetical protein